MIMDMEMLMDGKRW